MYYDLRFIVGQRRSLSFSKQNVISEPTNSRNRKLAFIPKASEYQ